MPNPIQVVEAGEAVFMGAQRAMPSAVRFVEEYLSGIIKSESRALTIGGQNAVAMRSPEGAALVFTDPLMRGSVTALVEKEGARSAIGFSDGARVLGSNEGARVILPGRFGADMHSLPFSGQSRLTVASESGQVAHFDALAQTRWQGRLDGHVLPARTNQKIDLGHEVTLQSKFEPPRGYGPGGRRPRAGAQPHEHFKVITDDAETGMRTAVSTDNGGSSTFIRHLADKETSERANTLRLYVTPGRHNYYSIAGEQGGKYQALLETPFERGPNTQVELLRGFFK